jgi:hypothetical protein
LASAIVIESSSEVRVTYSHKIVKIRLSKLDWEIENEKDSQTEYLEIIGCL